MKRRPSLTARIAASQPLFLIALLFGAVPACAGALIFLFWLPTRHPGLVVAGAAALIGGAASLAVSAGLLVLHLRRERGRGASATALARERRWGAIVLLANFPVAALLLFPLFASSESYSVTVRNRGLVPVDSFTIVDSSGSERTELGAFAPGEERTAAVRVRGKTVLTFEMVRFGQASTGTVVSDADPDLAADQWRTITIGVDGSALVEQ